jgi:hypothetical protein
MSGSLQCGWIRPEHWADSAVAGLNGAIAGGLGGLGYVFQFGLPGWFVSLFGPWFQAQFGISLSTVPIAIPMAAVMSALAVAGFVFGYCLNRLLRQLTLHRADVCISGLVNSLGQDTRWYLSWLWDPDRTFNLIVPRQYLSFVTDDAEFIGCTENGTQFIHCEIVSAVQKAACIGGMIGAAIGAVIGTILGIAAGASLGCGPFAFLCLLIALIIAAIVAAAVTAFGSWVGGEIGAAIGSAIDERNDLLGQGDSLSAGDCVTVQGDWVRDTDTGWNEIHPVKVLKLAGRIGTPKPFNVFLAEECPDDCAQTPPVVS